MKIKKNCANRKNLGGPHTGALIGAGFVSYPWIDSYRFFLSLPSLHLAFSLLLTRSTASIHPLTRVSARRKGSLLLPTEKTSSLS